MAEFLIKCVDAQTHVFVGYLRVDRTTTRQKRNAAVFTEAAADHEVAMINHFGKYLSEKVKR